MVIQKLVNLQAVQFKRSKNTTNTSSTSAECVRLKILSINDDRKLMNKNYRVTEFHFMSLSLYKVHSEEQNNNYP